MIYSLLLVVDQLDNLPSLWTWQRALTISISSLVVLVIASRTIKLPHVGPKMPLGPLGPLFNDISLAGFIGSMSFGHVLGTLITLGLSNIAS